MPPAHAAHSGKASLDEIAMQQRPSVALVDIAMPDMDGCEVVRRLRQGLPDILLIAINGRYAAAGAATVGSPRARKPCAYCGCGCWR